MKAICLGIALILLQTTVWGQTLLLLDSSRNTSFRGLSVVNNKTIWVSGSNGTVGKSLDGGKTWNWMQVMGYEHCDFRDIEAFDEHTAVLMATGSPARIFKTTNGGTNWELVFSDSTNGMFLDAMDFWNEQSGIVVGDPINGSIYIRRTFDGGSTWRGLPEQAYPTSANGEVLFAASGTNITHYNRREAIFVTGGTVSRLFIRNLKHTLPLQQGTSTTGANSIAVRKKRILIVGGDFTNDTLRRGTCVFSTDFGKTFQTPQTPPFGYRSCVAFQSKKRILACGTSGVDVSHDGGLNWINISRQSFHVVQKAKKGNAVFMAGPGGKIAKLID